MMLFILAYVVALGVLAGSCQGVMTSSTEQVVSEGDLLTLTCHFSAGDTDLSWYQKKHGSPPQLLVSEYSHTEDDLTKFRRDKSTFHVDLRWSSLHPHVVIYCTTRHSDCINTHVYTITSLHPPGGDTAQHVHLCVCDAPPRWRLGPASSATKSACMHHRRADMKLVLVCVLTAAWSLGSGDQLVQQPVGDMHALMGDAVKLDCSYKSSASNDYIFWYKKNGQAAPEFILSRFSIGQGKTEKPFEKRFSCSLNPITRQAPLEIQDVQLNDSAVYYCTLQPTMTDSSAAHAQKLL